MLIISDLHVEINHTEVLRGVNLTIPDHQLHVLFGPNGSGKSVLASTIMGYPKYCVKKGEIIYNGNKINHLKIDERVHLGISVMEQRPPVLKGVKWGDLAHIIVQRRNRDLLDENSLLLKYEMNPFMSRDINEGFSGGEVKKSELFLLLLAKPTFILLDEPDSGVDPEHLKTIGKMVNLSLTHTDVIGKYGDLQRKNSGILITHTAGILNYVHADKAHIMIDGQIRCSGDPDIITEQIREFGYEKCIHCQQDNQNDQS
jgi:Fe-S cluster assembly ATP-binding protein